MEYPELKCRWKLSIKHDCSPAMLTHMIWNFTSCISNYVVERDADKSNTKHISRIWSFVLHYWEQSVDNFIVVIMLLILWILMLIAEKHYFGIIIVISFVFITTRMDTKDVLLNDLWFWFLLLISNFALNYIIFISMNHSI